MPSLSKSQAIVLHLTRHGDSGAVVDVIDSVSGRQGLFVRGFGKGRGVSVSSFHPLSVLDVVTYTTPRSSLSYLREYSPAFSLNAIRSDIRKSTTALFLSEVLYRTQKRDNPDAALFNWLINSIVRFDAAEGAAANFHLWWMVGYCSMSGFRPLDVLSEDNPGSGIFSPDDSLLLHRLLDSSLEEALDIPLNSARRSAFASKMLDYLSACFGVTLEIKSLDVLRAVFS